MIRKLSALALAALMMGPGAARAEDDTVATVNGTAISRETLKQGVYALLQQRRIDPTALTDPDASKQLEQKVLDVLIGQELLYQDAKAKNLVLTDDEVRQEVDKVRASFPSPEEFTLRLTESGMTEEAFAEDLRRRKSIRRLLDRDVGDKVQLSDDEIHQFYVDNPDEFTQPDEIHVRHILLKAGKDADEAAHKAARDRIAAVLVEAKAGADFAALATKYSEDSTAPRGGDLGYLTRGELVKPFEDAAFALEPGQISDIVQTVYGYHIIKVEERRTGLKSPEKDVSNQIRAYLLKRKGKDAVEARVQSLRESGKVEIKGRM